MWNTSSDDIPYLPSKNTPRSTNLYTGGYDSPSSDSSTIPPPPIVTPTAIKNPRNLRWGRSNFSEDEIRALENPLVENENPLQNNDQDFRDTSVYFTNRNYNSNQIEPIQSSSDEKTKAKNLEKCQKFVGLILIILPAMCFAAAAHFINDIMTDFKLFSASFSVFQGVFWPAFVFLGIDLIGGKREQNDIQYPVGCIGLLCSNGRWKLSLLLLLHSTLSAVAMIAQLLSIQRLNISVSLALSFGPEVYIILLRYINRERRCSVELVIFSILTYLGFILVGIPAMISRSNRISEDLTAGVVASLVSMGLAIPASFILSHLRKSQFPDSLIATSFAFHGSVFSLLTKVFMDTTMDITFDPMSIGWAAGLITLVLIGTILIIMESKFGWKKKAGYSHPRISRMRMWIFIFSCFWELIRQGIWNTFPEVYDVFGSLLVVVAFLLAVGFEAWTMTMSDEVKNSSSPFQFFPWLFSRTKISNTYNESSIQTK